MDDQDDNNNYVDSKNIKWIDPNINYIHDQNNLYLDNLTHPFTNIRVIDSWLTPHIVNNCTPEHYNHEYDKEIRNGKEECLCIYRTK